MSEDTAMSASEDQLPQAPPEIAPLMPPRPMMPRKHEFEAIEAVDMLRLENSGLKAEIFKLREDNSRLQGQVQHYEDEAMQRALRDKYKLGPKDRIDPQTLRIVRGQ